MKPKKMKPVMMWALVLNDSGECCWSTRTNANVFSGPKDEVIAELERDWGYAFNKQTTYRLVRVRLTEVERIKQLSADVSFERGCGRNQSERIRTLEAQNQQHAERIAALVAQHIEQIMAGMMSAERKNWLVEDNARDAIEATDALIAELNKEQP